MAVPIQKTGAQTSMLSSLAIQETGLGFRLKQADFAKLLGCSRAYVCELIQKGIIPTERGGKIDPDRAVTSLLKRQPNASRLRFLVQIRTEIDEARSAAAAARADLEAAQRLITRLTRSLLEAERRFDLLVAGLPDDEFIELLIDSAFDQSRAATDNELLAALADSDTAALIAIARPDLMPPPSINFDENESEPAQNLYFEL